MTPQEKLIATAAAEIGYKEGTGNQNKYAEYFDTQLPEFYNTKKNGNPWCDIFVDWCFVQSFGDTGRKMLYQPEKSCGAGCTWSRKYYMDNGAFHDDPQVGDQVFFGTDEEAVHTGIVRCVRSDGIDVIEGNSSDKVQTVSYRFKGANICGYGRPNWSLAEENKFAAVAAKLREIADLLSNM